MNNQLTVTTVTTIKAHIQEQKNMWHLWLPLLVLGCVEYFVGLGYREIGVLMHTVVLFGLYFCASYWKEDTYKLYLALSLAPLSRIISLGIPPFPLPPVFYYLLSGAPMLVAAYLVAQENNISFREAFFGGEKIIQLIGGYFLGAVIGLMNYVLFKPQFIAQGYEELPLAVITFVILTASGFLEELLFRGILYRTAVKALGQHVGWVYSSLIYASLQFWHCSPLAVLSTLISALILANFVRRYDSLIGAGVAHAMANVFLFFIGPLLL